MVKAGRIGFVLLVAAALSSGGCATDLTALLRAASDELNRTIDNVQETDPRLLTDLPDEVLVEGGVDFEEGVEFVTDIEVDLADEDLAAITVLAFENPTGADMFIEYLVDGVPDAVWVFAGDTVILQYPCLFEVTLVSETDFDPVTGDPIAFFELPLEPGVNPAEVDCGLIVVFTITEEAIDVTLIEL